jgi:transcriptional regulator, putative
MYPKGVKRVHILETCTRKWQNGYIFKMKVLQVFDILQARTIIVQYVKEMRKKYKLTQVDLSEKAGVGLRFE